MRVLYKEGAQAQVSDALVSKYISEGWSAKPFVNDALPAEDDTFDIKELFEDNVPDTTDDGEIKPEFEADVEATEQMFTVKPRKSRK